VSNGFVTPFQMSEDLGDPRGVIVELAGEFDIAVADRVRARLASISAAGKPAVIDLREVTFIDSAGIAVLVGAVHAAQRNGTELRFDPQIQPAVDQILALTGIDRLLWPDQARSEG
jgi:anti-anti-sigma factor